MTAREEGSVPTGEDRVNAVLARLPELDQLPVAAHASFYEDAHRTLHDALTGAAAEPGRSEADPATGSISPPEGDPPDSPYASTPERPRPPE